MAKLSSELSSSRLRWPFLTRTGVVLAAILVLGVPLLYIGFLVGTGWLLVTGALSASLRWSLGSGWGGMALAQTVVLSAGFVTWIWFFRPFLLKPRKTSGGLTMLASDQPEWMQTVAMAVVQARAPMPVEVRMDASGAVRLEAVGMAGALGGRHRLTVGAGWVSVCGEGQLIADLVACLMQAPGGLTGRCYWILRGMTEWLERAANKQPVHRRAQQGQEPVAGLRLPKRGRTGWWHYPVLVKARAAYFWLTRRPVWLMLLMARMVARPALRAVTLAGDAAAARLLGSAAYAEVLRLKAGMVEVEGKIAKRVEEGILDGRLPDNLPQLWVRELERGGTAGDATSLPDGAARLQRWLRASLPPLIEKGGPAAGLVRRFSDISRQLSQMFYQQDLELPLGQFRLVAAGEAAKKNVENEAAQQDIQRYFEGLAHPHRSLCGLEMEGSGHPTLEQMRQQIEASRRQMRERGDQVRSLQKEWVMAWQRCRDMEMARAMALAGMPLDARQYGLTAHDERLYREEIARQEIIMEHSDEALVSFEVDFERRLAAALGLLMQSPRELLSAELQAKCGELPLWGAAYRELCARLPVTRRLINRVFAFESLGVSADDGTFKHAAFGEEISALRQVLDYLLPLIRQDMELVASGLERVACPLQPGTSVLAWLVEGKDTSLLGAEPSLADGSLAVILTERVMRLQQEVFAWLCRAAESVEKALLAPPEEAAAEVRRLPELRLGCDFQEPGDIAACVPVAAS